MDKRRKGSARDLFTDLPHESVRSRAEWSVGSVSMAREEGDGTRARLGDMHTRGRVATAEYTTQ